MLTLYAVLKTQFANLLLACKQEIQRLENNKLRKSNLLSLLNWNNVDRRVKNLAWDWKSERLVLPLAAYNLLQKKVYCYHEWMEQVNLYKRKI